MALPTVTFRQEPFALVQYGSSFLLETSSTRTAFGQFVDAEPATSFMLI
jgi:hypothetical protein